MAIFLPEGPAGVGGWLRNFCPYQVPNSDRSCLFTRFRTRFWPRKIAEKVLPSISPQSFLRESQFCFLRRDFL